MKKIILILVLIMCFLSGQAFAEPKYMLTLELSQSHFTLDLDQLIADELNKV